MAQNTFDVIALGLTAVDVLMVRPTTIIPDAKQFVSDLIIQGGAPTGSGASGIAMLGYRAAVVARLGNNTLSDIAREQFRRYHVSLDLVVNDQDSRPAIALVEIDPVTAARTVFINLDNYGYVRPQDIPATKIGAARVLWVDSYDLNATEAALKAASSGCRRVLDFEGGDVDRLRELCALGTDLIFPRECARRITDRDSPQDLLRGLSRYSSGQSVITDGIHGSWALENGNIIHQPAFRVAAVDSTGCGDAFHTGYIVGSLENWPLALRLELGSWLASIVATRVGGRTALPKRGEMSRHFRPDLSAELRLLVEKAGL